MLPADKRVGEMETVMKKIRDPQKAAALFRGWDQVMLRSCLQGMAGAVYADREESPASAAAVTGDFCFMAGLPDRQFVEDLPGNLFGRFGILVPGDRGWSAVIETALGGRVRRITRYAMEVRKEGFDRRRLEKIAAGLPEGYELRRIDRGLYDLCAAEAWSRDLVSQFQDYEAYRRLGAGFAVLKEGKPVSGASAYARCREGIEIEVDTEVSFRRRGLARICSAALILDCIDRSLYAGWDAHTQWSVTLAGQLGYEIVRAYPAYELYGNEFEI